MNQAHLKKLIIYIDTFTFFSTFSLVSSFSNLVVTAQHRSHTQQQ